MALGAHRKFLACTQGTDEKNPDEGGGGGKLRVFTDA